MRMTARTGAAIVVALIGCVAFAHFCVRIVPGNGTGVTIPARGEDMVTASDGPLMVPVAGVSPAQLSDTFTQARADGERSHDAIDIMAPRGAPVVAATAGRIEKLFSSNDGGLTIYQRSPDGTREYYYAHLDSYALDIRENMAVRPGQVIGRVGSTGNADPSAPHLHFAVHILSPHEPWHGGRAINPYPLLHAGR